MRYVSGEEACVVRGEDVHSRVAPMERTSLGTRTWTLSLPLLSLTSHLLGALPVLRAPCVQAHARVSCVVCARTYGALEKEARPRDGEGNIV